MVTKIRPFTPDDYAAVVDVANAVYPGYNDTVEIRRHRDDTRDPKCRHERWVAEAGGEMVGYGSYGQSSYIYHPRKFFVNVQVRPEHQGHGIGNALYERIVTALDQHHPVRLIAQAREDRPAGIRFLEARGFEEAMRDWESILDLATFDESAFDGSGNAAERESLCIATYAELAGDPNRDGKYYELDFTLCKDMPTTETLTPTDPEVFRRQVIESPDFVPDATLIALDGDRWVGLSALFAPRGESTLMNGTTGVLRDYRRRGIATALKLRNIRWAKANGYERIRTWNAQGNRAMLGINERLGFVKQPAWIDYVKDAKEVDL